MCAIDEEVVCVAVIDDCEVASGEDEGTYRYDGDFEELPSCRSKENVHDVRISETLSETQKSELRSLISNYECVLTDVPGKCNITEHRIPLSDDNPISSRPYPIPYSVRETLDKEIKEMLQMGIVQPSESPYASPIVMVRKKDGGNRVCIDYRRLNKITVGDPEPMPMIKDMFQDLAADKYFSKLDLSKGYWQIMMAPEDIHKTAFVSHNAKLEFVRMPFGTKSAGATLMRCMRKLLKGMEHVHNYIDDILVHTNTWEEHLQALGNLFDRLKQAGLTARPSKCEFGNNSVEFVGHKISRGLVEVSDANVKKVSEAERPKTKKQVRAFVALTGFYRDFIPNFSDKAKALTDLTKNKLPNKVKWDDEAEKSYLTLRSALISRPVLHLYDEMKPLVLRTDASESGLGAALLQETDGRLFPISYASRKLLEREKRYATIEKECLAIVWAIKKFALYLFGRQFVVQTDHKSLTYLQRAKFENARIMRWAMLLQQYSFRVEAIMGKDNLEADYLSRVGW